MKTRVHKDSNYKSIFFNGKTIRIAIDPNKPITELKYPEFFDVAITSKCFGKCKYCYQNSTNKGKHAENIIDKIKTFFGSMTPNQRPFQVAIGGGEPTLHPEFIDILKAFDELGIMPNYTTNGMHMTQDIVEATKKYCGGVAISAHKHLEVYWDNLIYKLWQHDIKVNLHYVISDKDSIDYFLKQYNDLGDLVSHHVLLPYTAQGRAVHKDIDWEYLIYSMPKDVTNIAFGAGFYEYLKKDNIYNVSLYEPESMSKYLDMMTMNIYPSSFAVQ